jgi:hypothetical protein
MFNVSLVWRIATAGIVLLFAGCASTQLNYNAVEVSGTLDSVYTKETLNNLSKFIDDPFAIPSQVMMVGGTIQTVNTINPSVTFPLAAQIAKTSTNTSVAVTTANTLAGVGAGVSGTNTAQQNYTISPLNDANTLRNQQALYRHAVYGTSLLKEYQPPRIFLQDVFYDDPYSLQLPHCVLCADKQGVFTRQPHPSVHANKDLPPMWLYWDGHPRLAQLQSTDDIIDLGHFGNHELFMRRSDYYAGVLTNFVVFTLPNTEPAEVFAAATPAPSPTPTPSPTPGPTPSPTPSPTPTPKAGSFLIPPPATNLRLPPASRQAPALVLPQGIQP